jgi:pimeloyl-ACP methyl ester carboxylesterase
MKPLRVDEHRVRSFDGTEIAYHTVGQGPTILLANGWRAWTHQIGYFQDRYRFLSWDYRGLYASGAPDDREAIEVDDHADDALAVLDEDGLDAVAIFGWSRCSVERPSA